MVADIPRDARVGLSLQGKAGILGKRPIFTSLDAVAEVIEDRVLFEKHWNAAFRDGFNKASKSVGLYSSKHMQSGSNIGAVKKRVK
jgi:general stress protein 26